MRSSRGSWSRTIMILPSPSDSTRTLSPALIRDAASTDTGSVTWFLLEIRLLRFFFTFPATSKG